MSTSVDNLTHVLSSVILHIYPDIEGEGGQCFKIINYIFIEITINLCTNKNYTYIYTYVFVYKNCGMWDVKGLESGHNF